MPEAVILCGGAGLRLRPVIGNAPKGMAKVAGRPFLEILFHQLRRHGFERAVLAVGYQSDFIQAHFGEDFRGLKLAYSVETSPLGTGGALRKAMERIESQDVLTMNGDSYTDADLADFAVRHAAARADVSVLLVPPDGRGDCGSVLLNRDGGVVSFAEKCGPNDSAFVNAGIYMLSRQMLYGIKPGVEVSLERDLFPEWLRTGRRIKGLVYDGRCIDIGTPERYRGAQQILADAELEPVAQQGEGER